MSKTPLDRLLELGNARERAIRKLPVEYDSREVKITGEPLSAIWWRGRQWAVTEYGIEALDGSYAIEKKRLFENVRDYPWTVHMSEKIWVDVDDFATAWLVAIALHMHDDDILVAVGRRGAQR